MSKHKKSKMNMTDESEDLFYESESDVNDASENDSEDDDFVDDMPNPEEMDFEKVKSSYFGTADWTGGLPDAAKVNDILRAQKQKKERERTLGIVHAVLYVLFFSGTTLCMAEYGATRTTDMEFFYSRFAMIFFLAALWTVQRVKLFNWQSLLLSIAFAPYAVFYPMMEGKTSTNVMIIVVELITRWMVLMLLTDVALERRIRSNRQFSSALFALFCVTAVFTLRNGNGGFAPIVFLYFLVLCFIPVSGKEWEKITDCIVYSGMLSFVVITIFSFTGNPLAIVPREFYMLTDDLGQFFGLSVGLATYGLLRFGKKYGRLSFPYFLSAFWLVATVIMILNKGTTGIILGVLLMFFVLFLFGPKMGKFPVSLIRPAIVLLIIAAIIVGMNVFANMIIADNFDTAAFAEGVMKSPLKLFANTAEDLIGKVETVHRGGGGYGDIIRPKTFWAYLNVFLDSRIGIFYETIGALGWDGHVLVGVNADSFVMATKNQYIQYLYEFGYFAGGLNILFYVAAWVLSVVKYAHTKKERFLLPALLGAMTFGVWFFVSSGIFYPLVFFFTLSLYAVLVDLGHHARHKKKEKKVKEAEEKKDSDEKNGSEKSGKKTESDSEENSKEKSEAVVKTEETTETEEVEEKASGPEIKEVEPNKEPQPVAETEPVQAKTKPDLKKILGAVEMLPEEKPKHRDFKEVEGRPLDRKQLEDEEIISLDFVTDKKNE